MVHQQELDDRVLRLLHAIGGGDHHHALLDRRGAARLELGHALDLHEAHAAGTHRLAELGLVAEVGDLHVALLGGVHEHHALGRLHLAAVDLERDQLRFRSSHYAAWSAGGAPTLASILSRSAASRARSMCCSNSPRNFLIIEPTGIAIESPSTHRQLPMMLVWTLAMMSRSIGVASPASMRSSIFTVQLVPSRHGTHLPQDSCR